MKTNTPVAWYHPDKPNNVINAAQYPHVLDKNKVGYLPCYLAAPVEPKDLIALSNEIVQALIADEQDGGFDLTAGLFGPRFSALLRGLAGSKNSTQRDCVIYLDEDPIDVAQFYRAKGFEKLPPMPTMSGAEIRACGWKKNDYQMFIDATPMVPVGDTQAIPLRNGMRFWCVPPATW